MGAVQKSQTTSKLTTTGWRASKRRLNCFLKTADNPGRNPDGIGALVRPGTMAPFPQHLNFQLPSCRREAAATDTGFTHPQAVKHVQPKHGPNPFHGAIGPHPGRSQG